MDVMFNTALLILSVLIGLTWLYLLGIRIETDDFDKAPERRGNHFWLASFFESSFLIRRILRWALLFYVCIIILNELPEGSRQRYLCKKYLIGFSVLMAELIITSGIIYLGFFANE